MAARPVADSIHTAIQKQCVALLTVQQIIRQVVRCLQRRHSVATSSQALGRNYLLDNIVGLLQHHS